MTLKVIDNIIMVVISTRENFSIQMAHSPSKKVLKAFDIHGEVKPLSGGEGRCWKGDGIILKPCENIEAWLWSAKNLPKVKPKGFRLPLPIATKDKEWVIENWCAQQEVEGNHPETPRWKEVIETGERLHESFKYFPPT